VNIGGIQNLSWDIGAVQNYKATAFNNSKLSLISYNQPFQASVPVSTDGLGQGDKQHLVWQYAGIEWTEAVGGITISGIYYRTLLSGVR